MASAHPAAQAAGADRSVTHRLVIAGSSEHARVVAEAAAAAGWELVGWVGPGPAPDGPMTGLRWMGEDDGLAERLATEPGGERTLVVLGFGGPVTRRRSVAELLGRSVSWATVIHPTAWVAPSARLGPGTVVLARAVVNTGATVGAQAIVNSGAIVEHDVVLGDFAHVAPGATIGGGARIGEDVFVGLNATVRDHVRVGHRVVVGMGAAVVADLPDDVTVTGVPAMPVDA
jgi:sugar O-acyltransferase (sialic acid O-acetyltransferase NeuD family)